MTNEVQISIEILRECLREAALEAVLNEKRTRQSFGQAQLVSNLKGKLPPRVATSTTEMGGRDIYGQEKSNEVRYFECSGCERSIAGNRFAAHVARCGGRRR